MRVPNSSQHSQFNLNRIKTERRSDMTIHRNRIADEARRIRKRQTIEGFKSIFMLHKIKPSTHTIEKFKRMNMEKSFDARLLLHSKGNTLDILYIHL